MEDLKLTETEWNTVGHALRLAADEYNKLVASNDHPPRVEEAFKKQAQAARALAEKITEEVGV